MADVATGHVLADRYEVGQPLGAGGSGAVWAAHDRVLDRTVAVKVVPDGAAAARLAREARATAGIGVENVVAVYDVGQQDDQHYLVMEYVDGVDLATLLAATGPLSPDLVALVGRDVARGVAAVHAADLIHRDVTPANVLVSTEGTVKLTDLGIARRTDDAATRALTEAGTVVGTVDYLAPEQVEGGEVTAASDVYAVGLVLHALATGAAPFGNGPVGERIARRLAGPPTPLDDDTGPLADVVAAAAAREPADRPPDGDALRRQLAPLVPEDVTALRERLADRVMTARSTGPVTRPDKTDAIEAVAFPSGARAAAAGAARASMPPEEKVADDAPAAAPPLEATTTILPDGGSVPPTGEGRPVDAAPPPVEQAPPPVEKDLPPPDPAQTDDRRPLLGPIAVGIGGIVVAIGVASMLLAGSGDGSGEDGADAPAPPAAPLAIAAVDDHDPLGGGSEHGDEIGRIADGDAQSAWDTEGYTTANLGGLKSGVGFLVDLGSPQEIAALELDMGLTGADVTVLVSDARPEGDPTATGTVFGAAEDTSGTVRIDGGPVTAQWVAVWFTSLADDGGRFRAEVAEVRVLGP